MGSGAEERAADVRGKEHDVEAILVRVRVGA